MVKLMKNVQFEKFQLIFCKSILDVHTRAHNGAVMGELGRLLLFTNIMKYSLKYTINTDEVKHDRPLIFQLLKRINPSVLILEAVTSYAKGAK